MPSIKERAVEEAERVSDSGVNATARELYTACVLDALVVWMADNDVDSALSAIDSSWRAYSRDLAASFQPTEDADVLSAFKALVLEFNALMDSQRTLIVKVREKVSGDDQG